MNRLAVILIMLLIAPIAAAQEQRPGVAIDSRGGAVIDPTRNVLDLVEAAIRRQDDLRAAEAKYQNAMRDAETRRINELASQKQLFDLELARVLRANVDAASLLLATQLKEVKNDLSDRTAKLEQFRWESGGRGAGQDAIIAYIIAGIMFLIAAGTLAVNGARMFSRKDP